MLRRRAARYGPSSTQFDADSERKEPAWRIEKGDEGAKVGGRYLSLGVVAEQSR